MLVSTVQMLCPRRTCGPLFVGWDQRLVPVRSAVVPLAVDLDLRLARVRGHGARLTVFVVLLLDFVRDPDEAASDTPLLVSLTLAGCSWLRCSFCREGVGGVALVKR